MDRLAMMSLIVAALMLTVVAVAADNDNHQYIKVEIRGILETGVVAIGGETTGTVINASGVTWELDFGDNKNFHDLTKSLHGKEALVTGTYKKIKGVEIRERNIVKVTTLKSAEEE